MTVQRTLNRGIKAGLVTGLGSSVADCIYASVGAFGLTVISEFLIKYSNIINLLGGSLVFVMGLGMIFKKKKEIGSMDSFSSGTKLFLSSFVIGITNPTAILTFLFAFSYFGLSEHMGFPFGIQLVTGVFLGTYLWWGILSIGTGTLKKRIKNDSIKIMNKVFGIILIIFGSVILVKNFFA